MKELTFRTTRVHLSALPGVEIITEGIFLFNCTQGNFLTYFNHKLLNSVKPPGDTLCYFKMFNHHPYDLLKYEASGNYCEFWYKNEERECAGPSLATPNP